jgi:hypothetical protein
MAVLKAGSRRSRLSSARTFHLEPEGLIHKGEGNESPTLPSVGLGKPSSMRRLGRTTRLARPDCGRPRGRGLGRGGLRSSGAADGSAAAVVAAAGAGWSSHRGGTLRAAAAAVAVGV